MDAHRLMSPRIVVLITSIDSKGNPDVAPYSFVTPVSMDPGMVAVSIAPQRHTMSNIQQTKQFVINIPTSQLVKSIMAAAKTWRPDLDKIKESWLTTSKSKEVKPPRINECVGWLECELEWIKEAGDHNLVVGKVVKVDYDPELMRKDGLLDLEKFNIPLHLGGRVFVVPGAYIEA